MKNFTRRAAVKLYDMSHTPALRCQEDPGESSVCEGQRRAVKDVEGGFVSLKAEFFLKR